jgi:serine/threonine protein kinase
VQRWNLIKLLRHPHLVQIDAAGVSIMAGETVAYLVMQQAEENLAEILRDRPLTTDETREMLLQVASAVGYLDSQGIRYGDVNISRRAQCSISSNSLLIRDEIAHPYRTLARASKLP